MRVEPGTTAPIVYAPLIVGERTQLDPIEELAPPGPLPHPLAESIDVSKVVRIDDGTDEDYTALGGRLDERR